MSGYCSLTLRLIFVCLREIGAKFDLYSPRWKHKTRLHSPNHFSDLPSTRPRHVLIAELFWKNLLVWARKPQSLVTKYFHCLHRHGYWIRSHRRAFRSINDSRTTGGPCWHASTLCKISQPCEGRYLRGQRADFKFFGFTYYVSSHHADDGQEG